MWTWNAGFIELMYIYKSQCRFHGYQCIELYLQLHLLGQSISINIKQMDM